MADWSQLLQYGGLGLLAYLAQQLVLPILKDYVFPSAQAERDRKSALEEREVRTLELLTQTMGEFKALLATMEQRLCAVERSQEAIRDDMTVVVERLPGRRSPKNTGGAA